MIYREFLKTYGIHLFDESPRNFSKYALERGWAEWDKSGHRDKGLCCDKETGDFFLFTSTQEMRRNLKYRVYHLGEKMIENKEGEYELEKS